MSLNKFTIQKSFAISTGAGSGKTYTLSRRYINALLGFDYFRECYNLDEHKQEKDRTCFEVHKSYFDGHAIKIFDTRGNIEAGKFGFNNSDEKMCGWCDIKHICHENVLKKECND